MIVSMARLFQKFSFLCVCTLAVLFLAQQVSNAAPSRKPSPEKENDFDRPGTPILLDETVQGESVGPNYESDIGWVKSSIAEPNGGQRNYGGNGHGRQFTYDTRAGGGDVSGDYKKVLGVYYQDNNDKGDAERTSVYYRFAVEINKFEIGVYRLPLTIVAPQSYGKIEITTSDGGPSYSIEAQATIKGSGDPSVSFDGKKPKLDFSIPGAALEGQKLVNPYKAYPAITKSLGAHSEGSPFKYYVEVSGTGRITADGNGISGKAWGRIAWNFYIIKDYGNGNHEQIPYKFPTPKHGGTLISFYE